MKKIFYTVLLACTFLYVNLYVSADSACSRQEKETVTGSACSISELNNLETDKIVPMKKFFKPDEERNLRPVRFKSETFQSDCLFGICLYKKIFTDK